MMISIIYVYYDSYDVIVNSIQSVLNNKTGIEYEIIVVVNKDSDNKIKHLKSIFSEIKIIFNKSKNTGFSYANNLGAKSCNASYLLFLNPDTILEDNVLEGMLRVMTGNPEFGAGICMLQNKDGSIQKTAIRKEYNLGYIIVFTYFLHKIPLIKLFFQRYYYNTDEYLIPQFPKVISGAFMFIKRDVFEDVGGFDDSFLVFSEDSDLSFRIGQISKLFYYPDVRTVHLGSTTLGRIYINKRLKLYYSSLFYFINKQFGKKQLFILKIILKINGFVLLPFTLFIRNKELKHFIYYRCKYFIKMPISL